jgi:peptidoglycan/LPS O-acetylase OafA/YrhL
MEAKKQTQKPAALQTARGAPFCLRLNTLRALCAACVILTHVIPFLGFWVQFRSLYLSGHFAVYFFFALSGYLLTLSFIKEIKRRLSSEDKSKSKSPPTARNAEEEGKKRAESESEPLLMQIDLGDEKKVKGENGEPKSASTEYISPMTAVPEITIVSGKEETKKKRTEGFGETWIETAQKSQLLCMLCKFLWNRTWRLFPLFYACCIFLKISSIQGHDYHPGPMPDWTWKDIFLLRKFPSHLWTMRVEMMFSYYVLPFYIAALYGTFKLQKMGYERAYKCAFAGIVLACLFVAIFNIADAGSILIPWYYHMKFWWNLPPFFFGMLMGLLNYQLEIEFNNRQAAAKAKALAEAAKKEDGEEPVVQDQKPKDTGLRKIWKYVLSLLYRHRYSIIFYAVLLRIAFLNPGFGQFYTENYDLKSYWYSANRHSYWPALFVLINDTHGGFWKFMHTQPEPEPTTLFPTDFHKLVYYYGLWSYTIYLIHPLPFNRLGIYLGQRAWSMEFVVLSVVLVLPLAGIIDFLIDKTLVNRIILGKIVPFIGKILDTKKTAPAPEADGPPYSKLQKEL